MRKRGEAAEREADIPTLEGLLVPGPGLPSGAGTGLLLIPTPWVSAMASSVLGQPPAPTPLRSCLKPLQKLHRQEWCWLPETENSKAFVLRHLLPRTSCHWRPGARRARKKVQRNLLPTTEERAGRASSTIPPSTSPIWASAAISAWTRAQPGLRQQAPLPLHCTAVLDSLQGGNSEVSIKCRHP